MVEAADAKTHMIPHSTRKFPPQVYYPKIVHQLERKWMELGEYVKAIVLNEVRGIQEYISKMVWEDELLRWVAWTTNK